MPRKILILIMLTAILLLLASCYRDIYGCKRCEFFNATTVQCEKAACCEDDDCGNEAKCLFPGEENAECVSTITCEDNTIHNQCSVQNKSSICYFGELYERCSRCGCEKGYKCINDSCERYNTVILLVHGFNADHYAWKRFENWFKEDHIKNVYDVDLVPSIGNITMLSWQLSAKINNLLNETKADKVDVVAHSMGGLVTRTSINSGSYDNQINKLIMIGTPNQGAIMGEFKAFQLNETMASKQMSKGSDFMNELNSHLLNENITYFTIIGVKYNTYAVKHDGLVLEEEVRIPGVDYMKFNLSHSELINDYEVYRQVKRKLMD